MKMNEKSETIFHTIEICLETETNNAMQTDTAIRQIIDNLTDHKSDHLIINESGEVVKVKINNVEITETQTEMKYEY